MKVLILAAGYATRLYPLTLTQPKPLLPVAGKPMIDYVMDNVGAIEGIDGVYVVTNSKFAGHFQKWADAYPGRGNLTFKIINDGSTEDANRLGAIADLRLALQQEKIDDDLLVVAGDNLFSEKLKAFGEFCKARQAPVLGVYDVGSMDSAKKYGVVKVDATGKLVQFVEKPQQPASTLIGIALYYYPKATLPLIEQYLQEGNNPDQPGRLIQWLYPRTAVYAWTVPGIWYDIGSKETLTEASRIFSRTK